MVVASSFHGGEVEALLLVAQRKIFFVLIKHFRVGRYRNMLCCESCINGVLIIFVPRFSLYCVIRIKLIDNV